ncbi:MAG: oxidoreductase [Chitinophagales bacterium]|nr:MAG: oxidoreductase [Chitinophagales bacterium]
MSDFRFIPYRHKAYSEEEMLSRAKEFYALLNARRSIREFSDKPVPAAIIENIIMTASTAPSGAHRQPWTFCAVADAALKREIRKAAEAEEYENYHGRMPKEWLDALAPFCTDWKKPFLETAPWLIVVFRRIYEIKGNTKANNYYVNESVGIATGMLLAAIHYAGLVALTHTPSPMQFLGRILNRSENEKPFLLIPVGYPADGVKVPDLKRKSKEEVLVIYS